MKTRIRRHKLSQVRSNTDSAEHDSFRLSFVSTPFITAPDF